jgi:hypothetical protein
MEPFFYFISQIFLHKFTVVLIASVIATCVLNHLFPHLVGSLCLFKIKKLEMETFTQKTNSLVRGISGSGQ